YAPRYDELNAGPLARAVGFDELRASLLAQASGSVLEVAVGTGLNLPLYDWQQVKSVRAVDLSEGMLAQAQARITALPSLQTHQDDITLSQDNAESLSMGDNSFDCVVDTYSLCVLEHPLAALKEMARVVRPFSEGGRVLLLEHARAELPLLGWYQCRHISASSSEHSNLRALAVTHAAAFAKASTPVADLDVSAATVAATSKGCMWNQDVSALLAAAGLRVIRLSRHTGGTVVMVEAVRDA
ncbi:hypothetical protein QJQ45_027134, partial [Haematococcus lacustris]